MAHSMEKKKNGPVMSKTKPQKKNAKLDHDNNWKKYTLAVCGFFLLQIRQHQTIPFRPCMGNILLLPPCCISRSRSLIHVPPCHCWPCFSQYETPHSQPINISTTVDINSLYLHLFLNIFICHVLICGAWEKNVV